MKFYYCEICGNIIEFVEQSGVPVMCCGQQMKELQPGISDGAMEKHVPVVKVERIDGEKVQALDREQADSEKAQVANSLIVTVGVGTVEHPMTEAHYIQWILLETTKGIHRIYLEPTDKPRAQFTLSEGEEVVAAYEYCNLHGLWETR